MHDDVARVAEAVSRGDINERTTKGGFGGFRLVNSRLVDGDTLLHVALAREANPEVVACLVEKGIDVALRNVHGKTARDLKPRLFDFVLPLKEWSINAVAAWAGSVTSHIEYKDAWVRVFELFRVDGPQIIKWTQDDDFRDWVAHHLVDLTRAGFSSTVLDDETALWLYEFDVLQKNDMKQARKYKSRACRRSAP